MKAFEHYFLVVMFIMLYKVVLAFESMDELLNCENLNESYWAMHFNVFYHDVQGIIFQLLSLWMKS